MGRKSQSKSLSQLLYSPLLLAERAPIVLLDPKTHAALREKLFKGAVQGIHGILGNVCKT